MRQKADLRHIAFPPPPTTFVPPSPSPSVFLRVAPFRARRAGHLYWSKRSIAPRHCTASHRLRPLAPSACRPHRLQPSSQSAPSPSAPARACMFPALSLLPP
ncbi:hypothetical protein K523DRAFT_325347 [Schizophyllum commune Tattone D]|nr:hypothetical protein K523DRAFT_325347 [Schizophyllum commune Tattone D]